MGGAGGLLVLVAFLVMPLATAPFLGSITGAELAGLTSEQRWLGAIWLVPLAAFAVVAVAIRQLLLGGAASGRRHRASAILSVSSMILLTYLAACVLVENEIGGSAAGASNVVGMAGAGFWVAIVGASAGVIGGALGADVAGSRRIVSGAVGALVVMGAVSAGLVVLLPVPDRLVARSDGSGSATTGRPAPLVQPAPRSAREDLDQVVAGDRTDVEPLVGIWVAQLSAKRVGLEADGIIYDYEDILEHYRFLAARQSGALLLRSGDYASFRESGFYVAIAPQRFATGDAALAWCASQGLGRDDCFAKRIVRSGGPEGNTLYPR